MAKARPESAKARKPRTALPAIAKVVPTKIWMKEATPKFNLGETGDILVKNIKLLISHRGYTSFESFAFACNIPKSTLSQIINRTRDPRLGTIEQIAHVLGVTVGELLGEPKSAPNDW